MKKVKKQKQRAQTLRGQRKHLKAVARKGKGAQYGAQVKMYNKMPKDRIVQQVIQGTDSREVLNTMFTEDKDKDTITIS